MKINNVENQIIVDALAHERQAGQIEWLCDGVDNWELREEDLDIVRTCLGRYQTFLEKSGAGMKRITDVDNLYCKIHLRLFPINDDTHEDSDYPNP